ncbi:ATP-binding protein [Streptomyces griseorubiginosus]|uniref:ATP-binding protein n=1 Tax=Streptomyces griseorubiginosus TaxID=67304 RepID=UPI0036EB408F
MGHEVPLIASLRAAVGAAPDDVPLRLHLSELLLAHDRADEAVAEIAAALRRAPGNAQARALMTRAMTPTLDPDPTTGFDWERAEKEFAGIAAPYLTAGTETPGGGDAAVWEVEDAGRIRLADVGGMLEVKQRLEAAFLAPMRNPELRELYGKQMRGGLLLYGPPGCGKTFIARAVAGELGARFMSVGLNDVLDMYIGQSERNLHEVFETARRSAPCVVFLDELDALGAKRGLVRHSGLRNSVNQLLAELDGMHAAANEGVFVLAATNHPWDVDTALRRPGRLDRTLLVLPPDAPARQSILRYHLRNRPVADVNLTAVARRTDGYSGADLAHVCDTAAERALMDSVATGTPRMIRASDLAAALSQVRPSTGPWFESARNVAMFANDGGMYDDLLTYFKRRGKHRS